MHGMTYIGRVISNFRDFYNDINGATLTGAIDVIVVEQPDGTFNCSPFHVRFGKIGVLRSREKVVDIEVNGESLDIHMKLGESGEAFFVEEIQDSDNEEIPEHLATSPIPVSNFEELYQTSKSRRRNSLDLDAKPVFENEVNDYTKRRHTASTDDESSAKMRERDFFKRQIGLGNIELTEASAEDLTLSLQSNSNKLSSGDLSQGNNSMSEPIFTMDSLEMDKSPQPTLPSIDKKETIGETLKVEEVSSEGKIGKKKRRKKSLMKKKNAIKKPVSIEADVPDVPNVSIEGKASDSATERSSLDSASDPELKEVQQKSEHEMTPIGNRKMLDPDFHFFSDTELTSGVVDSRPCTPTNLESVLSDTEFEVNNRKGENKVKDSEGQSWAWGEFPISKSQPTSPITDSIDETAKQNQSSMINSVWSFMIYQRKNTSSEGIYLADLCSGSVNPEVAALYIPDSKKEGDRDGDVDCESGNGPSLTQSPTSGGGCKSIDSDFEEHNKSTQNYLSEVALSLCGWEPQPNEDVFARHEVPYLDYCNNPSIIDSPKLVIRIDDKYYTWKVAAPMITSLMIFHRSLPQYAIDQLCRLHMPSTAPEDKNKGESSRKYSWWGWPRGRSSREATPNIEPTINEVDHASKEEEEAANAEVEAISSSKMEIPEEGYSGSQSSGSDNGKDNTLSGKNNSTLQDLTKTDKYRKTLRLSSEQIKQLNLRDGMNEVEFSVTTAYQGTTRCKCHLYKWKWDDKIVISDIDGTITKSDVLGHILPIVGKDWAQSGVAQLFNKIKDNGYKLLYLSARAIGQARVTREYLKSIKQNDLYMPDGPILLNPTSLITAFHREVIEKKPEQFKISCMSDIRALFPLDANPFYAGYGNRINDVWAYRAVGIPIERIFTINPKGELKHELTQTFQSSYSNMSSYVDQLFPLIQEAANDYSQFSYWRDPLPCLEELDESTA